MPKEQTTSTGRAPKRSTAESPPRACPFHPRGVNASRIIPAASEAVVPTSVMQTVRRLKKRPRILPGTRSPIHAVQALLPRTPRIAAAATTTTKSWSFVSVVSRTNGSTTMGSQMSRAAPIVMTATTLGPKLRVSHAPGSCRTWEARGSAPTSPMTSGVAPRERAHAVRTAPPAQAAKSSETAPSAHEARSEARTDPTWRPASPRRAAGPGTGAAARAGALPGSDSPGCGTEGAEATRSIGWRGVLFSTFFSCRLRYRALTRSPARLFQAVRARRQRSSNRARDRCHASSLAGGLSAVSAIGSVPGRGRSMSARHPRPRESSSEEQINGKARETRIHTGIAGRISRARRTAERTLSILCGYPHTRRPTRRRFIRRPSSSVSSLMGRVGSLVDQDRDVVGIAVRHDQVLRPVAIEVTTGHGDRAEAGTENPGDNQQTAGFGCGGTPENWVGHTWHRRRITTVDTALWLTLETIPLGDRGYVMTARPGRIKAEVAIAS